MHQSKTADDKTDEDEQGKGNAQPPKPFSGRPLFGGRLEDVVIVRRCFFLSLFAEQNPSEGVPIGKIALHIRRVPAKKHPQISLFRHPDVLGNINDLHRNRQILQVCFQL